jgi:cytochrome c oxidase cbb3-type subunit 3
MKKYQIISKFFLLLSFLFITNYELFAQDTTQVNATPTGFSSLDMLYSMLTLVIVLFALIIIIISMAILSTIKSKNSSNSSLIKTMLMFFMFNTFSFIANAETVEAEVVKYPMLSNWEAYFLLAIVIILFFVVLMLVKIWSNLMGIKLFTFSKTNLFTSKDGKTLFQRFNNTVSIEEEDSLDLAHNYDGIRELDNKIPSWWSWTFAASIAFGFIYIYQMFSTQAIPSQYVELARENIAAEALKKEYLKSSANNIDENNVVMLKADGIANGASLFSKNCVACHGDKGQGNTVGPNLTDAYWLHKGGVKNIFYSIKYGWQEKGMKPWKDDFSPLQIAELSSYIASIQGSNPPGAKEKQGELFSDSSLVISVDSMKTN